MVLGVVIGLVVGLAASLLWHQFRHSNLQAAARTAEARLADAQTAMAQLTAQLQAATAAASSAETARAVVSSELELLKRSEEQLRSRSQEERQHLVGAFAELSAEALQKNNEHFLALAETKLSQAQTAAQGDLLQRQQAIAQLLSPLSETLARYELGLQKIEVERKGAYEGLSEKVAQLHLGNERLQKETRNLERTVGRDPAPARRRNGRDALALRLRRAGLDHHRRGSPAARHDRPRPGGWGDRG
jgi:DNA recombination protein RmuC